MLALEEAEGKPAAGSDHQNPGRERAGIIWTADASPASGAGGGLDWHGPAGIIAVWEREVG